jgi:hypothetical protein
VDEWVRRFDPKSRWGATRIHSITQVDRTGVPAFLRASGLPLLPTDNPHVASDLKKIRKTQPLSPILLVRGDVTANRAAHIADVTAGSAPVTTSTRTPISRAASSTFLQVTDPAMLATILATSHAPVHGAAKVQRHKVVALAGPLAVVA